MKIHVDADACSVIKKIEKMAREKNIPVILYCDTAHLITSSFAEVKYIDKGHDAVDFAIVNACEEGDIVVTNDGGLAALALIKKSYVLNSSGGYYSKSNITTFLNERAIRQRANRNGIHKVRGFIAMNKHPEFTTTLASAIRMAAG